MNTRLFVFVQDLVAVEFYKFPWAGIAPKAA